MKKQALSLAVCIAGAYPLSSGAIGLGDIQSSSHLNQPLNAKIELLSTSAQEAKQIQVRLASVDVFNRVGIERPDYLNSLRFTPTIQNGKPVILVSSTQAIKEPFLNFLLEVSWPKGQLLKEYTVLLDPPTLLQTGETTDSNTAAVRAEPKSVGFVKRPTQVQQRTQARNQQQVHVRDGITLSEKSEAKSTPSTAHHSTRKSKYRVRSGDTLYKIASRLKPRGVSSDQMMVALFRANPEAFRKGNINRLKAGSTLKVPSRASNISTREAKRLIRKHYAEWKQYRKKLAKRTIPQRQTRANSHMNKSHSDSHHDARMHAAKQTGKAHLEVMGSKNSGSESSSKVSAAGKARIEELDKQLALAREALVSKQRENAELKSRISELESMIQTKNRLIALKDEQLAKLQRSLANAGKPAENANNAAASANHPATVNTDLSTHLANKANQDAGKIIRAQGSAANGQNAHANTPVAQQHENKLTPAALAEKRRAAAMEAAKQKDQEQTPEETGFKPEKKNALLDLLSSPIVAAAGAGTIFLLLLGWWLLSRRKNTPSDDQADEVALPDFDDDEINIDGDDNDSAELETPVAEKFKEEFEATKTDSEGEFATSVTKETPETDNISTGIDDDEDDILQEADVYIVYGLHEQAETELKKAIAEHPEKLEYRHKLLENYIAANNKEAFDLQAQELYGLDGKNKAAIWEKVVEMGRKISPDNPLYQTIDTDGDSSSSTTGKVAAGVTAAAAAGIAAAAMSTDDDTAADSTESEAEEISDDFDIDDLLLDDDNAEAEINASDEVEQIQAETEATQTAETSDLDDDFSGFDLDDDDFNLDDLEKELDENATELASDEAAETDQNNDNIIDFESMLLNDEASQEQEANDELDVANLNLEVDNETGIDRILPKDTAYTPQGNIEEDDDILSFLDLPEEDLDLQEAHISTKLDLARAYLDMGDIEGARSTLEEVIVEGSEQQKQEAEELLHQTG